MKEDNKPKIEVKKRNSAFAELKDFCLFSMGERTDKGDFLEVTEWANGEGYDVHISDVDGNKTFTLTWGQMEALRKCVKAIEKSIDEDIRESVPTYKPYSPPVNFQSNGTDKVPYHTICSCNPANGGSGICGCVMANQMVDRNLHSNILTSTTTNLKSLDEHNSTAWSNHTLMFDNSPKPNGISCPHCGKELMDTNPMITLTSNPAKKNVHCSSCDYKGYRIA